MLLSKCAAPNRFFAWCLNEEEKQGLQLTDIKLATFETQWKIAKKLQWAACPGVKMLADCSCGLEVCASDLWHAVAPALMTCLMCWDQAELAAHQAICQQQLAAEPAKACYARNTGCTVVAYAPSSRHATRCKQRHCS